MTYGFGEEVATGAAIGSGARRFGGVDRVTGAQKYVADLVLPDLLHVALVTIPVGKAVIESVDLAAAAGMPGVVDILTGSQLGDPIPRFGPAFADRPVISDGTVNYFGEPVAAVAARSLPEARAAAAAVDVGYRELPGAYDLDQALSESAPLVQPPHLRPGDPLQESNVFRERRYAWGDLEGSAADLVIENDYTFPMVTHFAIEPHAVIVNPTGPGLDIYSPVQHPYLLQRVMAELFALPLTRMRVFAPDPGGAFGGKQNPIHQPLVAHLALRTGRPCKLVLSLEETFQSVRRTSCRVHARTGFTSDGRITFQDIAADYLIGAYVDIAERVMTKGSYLAAGPYRLPAARIVGRAVLSNTTPACAFRGFGTPEVSWATESQINEAAARLGLDGLEIRLRNLADKGDTVVPGEEPADGHWPESLRAAAEGIGWHSPCPPGRGRGIAVAIKSGATTGLSQATVRFQFDGSAIVYAGTSDMGQGARTIFAQIVADELGIPLAKVTVVSGDTEVVPFDLQTSASRSTVFMGNAIVAACADLHRQLLDLTGSDSARVERGQLVDGGSASPLEEVLRRGLGRLRGELIGTGRWRKPDEPDHPLGGSPAFYEFNCTAVEAEVDTETGEILLHRYASASDVGRSLNPLQVEAQDEGAAIMGLGHTLMEHLVLDAHGRIRNLGALDYRIPTTKDVPRQLHTIAIENGDGPGPYGAKGISEGALLCTAPAVSAAVAAATGVIIRDLPLTAERVWSSLRADPTSSRTRG